MSVAEAAPPATAQTRASGSSFYAAMRILPRAQRDGMFEIYSFCRLVDDIADDGGPQDLRVRSNWSNGGGTSLRSSPARSRSAIRRARQGDQAIRSAEAGFLCRDRRHGNGCARKHSGARFGRRSIFIATGWRALSAASACASSACREAEGAALAHHLGRALQLTNILRDLERMPRSTGCICRARRCAPPALRDASRTQWSPIPISPLPARR